MEEYGFGSPGFDRASGRLLLVDQLAALGGVLVGEQTRQRHVEEVGVGEERVAVGEGKARSLQEQVKRARSIGVVEIRITLEDVERLAHRRAAARWRAHAPDVEPAVADPRGPALESLVALDVLRGHQAGPPGVVCIRRRRRVLRGVGHRPGELAAVEAARSAVGDQAVGAREVAVDKRVALVARGAVVVEVELGAGWDVVEPVDVRNDLRDERGVDGEAVARDLDARPQRPPKRPAPVAAQGALPAGNRARHARGQAAVAGLVEGQRGPVLDERVGLHRARRLLAGVDRRDLAAGGSDHHEAAAPDAARERLGHAEHGGGRDGRVHGVAAAPEHTDGGLGAERVDGRGGPAATYSGRRFLRLLGLGDLRIDQNDGQGSDEQQPQHAVRLPGALPGETRGWRAT